MCLCSALFATCTADENNNGTQKLNFLSFVTHFYVSLFYVYQKALRMRLLYEIIYVNRDYCVNGIYMVLRKKKYLQSQTQFSLWHNFDFRHTDVCSLYYVSFLYLCCIYFKTPATECRLTWDSQILINFIFYCLEILNIGKMYVNMYVNMHNKCLIINFSNIFIFVSISFHKYTRICHC